MDSMYYLLQKRTKFLDLVPINGVFVVHNGLHFVLGITRDKELYGWGRNDFGQLAKPLLSEDIFKPNIININDKIINEISCGTVHTLMLTSDGIVNGWGRNAFGQIGCGKELGKNISVVTQLKTLMKIKSIHCSFNKSFALTDNGMVYSWGYSRHCRLGHKLEENEYVFEPKLINLLNITSICSSNNNTYFLSKEGNIYFCGLYYDENNKCFQKSPKIILFWIKSPELGVVVPIKDTPTSQSQARTPHVLALKNSLIRRHRKRLIRREIA